MSPAAWELREASPPSDALESAFPTSATSDRPIPEYTPQSYLQDYTRDLYVMVAIKSLILVRCESFLRPETVAALAGHDAERSLQIDDAFWRVWTFCKIFGCNKHREGDTIGQMDWLRGGVLAHQDTCSSSLATSDHSLAMFSALLNPPESFARGNGHGLTPNQLWDMTEIWTCLGVLLHGFHAKRDIARTYGVFHGQEVHRGEDENEDAMLGKLSTENTFWVHSNYPRRRMGLLHSDARSFRRARPGHLR